MTWRDGLQAPFVNTDRSLTKMFTNGTFCVTRMVSLPIDYDSEIPSKQDRRQNRTGMHSRHCGVRHISGATGSRGHGRAVPRVALLPQGLQTGIALLNVSTVCRLQCATARMWDYSQDTEFTQQSTQQKRTESFPLYIPELAEISAFRLRDLAGLLSWEAGVLPLNYSRLSY